MNDVANLVTQHEPGFKGLKNLYPRELLKKALLWPMAVSLVLVSLFLATRVEPVQVLTVITDATISVMPSLLGFLLGGYTILISFSNNKLLGNLTQVPKNSTISIYQKVSSIFALTILVQSATLLFALIIRFSMLINIHTASHNWLLLIATGINYGASYLLMVMLLYTVFAFKDIIINIFSLTQTFHLTIVIEQDESELDTIANNAAADKPRRNGGAY